MLPRDGLEVEIVERGERGQERNYVPGCVEGDFEEEKLLYGPGYSSERCACLHTERVPPHTCERKRRDTVEQGEELRRTINPCVVFESEALGSGSVVVRAERKFADKMCDRGTGGEEVILGSEGDVDVSTGEGDGEEGITGESGIGAKEVGGRGLGEGEREEEGICCSKNHAGPSLCVNLPPPFSFFLLKVTLILFFFFLLFYAIFLSNIFSSTLWESSSINTNNTHAQCACRCNGHIYSTAW